MNTDYTKAQALSYSGNQGATFAIPRYQRESLISISLGFQPLGIASLPFGNDTLIAVAAYFEPAICMIIATENEAGLCLKVNWIRGAANFEGKSIRIFPDIYGPGDANRMQTVNFGPDGALLVTRNADREFFVLSPPDDPLGKWILSDRFRLQGQGMLHSALLEGEVLNTIESAPDLKTWFGRKYVGMVMTEEVEIEPWEYGIARNKNNQLLTITDYRACETRKLGILADDKMLLPSVHGNGIALLHDGSAIVTRYGHSVTGNPFLVPGELIFVPSSCLD